MTTEIAIGMVVIGLALVALAVLALRRTAPVVARPMARATATEGVKRMQLPSGAWWEIASEMTWGMAKRVPPGSADSLDHILVAMTTAWSYERPISYESLQELPARDLALMVGEVTGLTAPLRIGTGRRWLRRFSSRLNGASLSR